MAPRFSTSALHGDGDQFPFMSQKALKGAEARLARPTKNPMSSVRSLLFAPNKPAYRSLSFFGGAFYIGSLKRHTNSETAAKWASYGLRFFRACKSWTLQ